MDNFTDPVPVENKKPRDVFCGKNGMLFTAFGEDANRMAMCIKNPYENNDTNEVIYVEFDSLNSPPNMTWACSLDKAKILFLEALNRFISIHSKDAQFIDELASIRVMHDGMVAPFVYCTSCNSIRISVPNDTFAPFDNNEVLDHIATALQPYGNAVVSYSNENKAFTIDVDLLGSDIEDGDDLSNCVVTALGRYVIEHRVALLNVIDCVQKTLSNFVWTSIKEDNATEGGLGFYRV